MSQNKKIKNLILKFIIEMVQQKKKKSLKLVCVCVCVRVSMCIT